MYEILSFLSIMFQINSYLQNPEFTKNNHNLRFLMFRFFLSAVLLFLIHHNSNAQVFSESKSSRSEYQIEAGYQIGNFNSPSDFVIPQKSKIDGVLFLIRQYPGLVYISFGTTSGDQSNQKFVMAGLEYPAMIFPKIIGRNEMGLLFSGITDYANWKRLSDDILPKFEVSSLGVLGSLYYRNVQRNFEFHTRISYGYGFAYQFYGSENGSQNVLRSSIHLVFPQLIMDYGISVSGFYNLSNWKFSTSELSAESQQT